MAQYLSLSKNEVENILKTEIIGNDGKKFLIKNLTSDGPVIINFISGTWCPLCMNHLNSLINGLADKNAKIIIISNESKTKLNHELVINADWSILSKEQILFHSDPSRYLINLFKVKMPIFGFARPATFLIQKNSDQFIIISKGIPNKEKTVCELSFYTKLKTA